VIFLGQSMLHDAFNQLTDTNARFVVWGAQLPGQKYCSIGSDNLLGGGARRAIWHGWGGKRSCSSAAAIPKRCSAARLSEALKESGIEADPALVVRSISSSNRPMRR
jgi:DNA-binding LacI/PurR family transcriptional regulator